MRDRGPGRVRIVVAAVAALSVSACGSAASGTAAEPTASSRPAMEVTVTHAQGETTVPVDPETVVVFDLGTLSSMAELGIEAAGVPEVAALPASLEQYASDEYPKVGSVFEPDYEQVNALDPDLIIVAGRSSEVYPDLAEIAPTIDLTVDNADFLNSFRERTETLATVFGVQDQAAEELDAIDESVERVSRMAADAGEALIVLTTGGEISAYGPGSRFGLLHDALGVAPAVEDLDPATHGDAISFEFLLEHDPDLLYVLDRDAAVGEDGQAAQQVLDNEVVAQTTAMRNGDVVYLDPTTWYLSPNGLGSVESMIAEVEASLE